MKLPLIFSLCVLQIAIPVNGAGNPSDFTFNQDLIEVLFSPYVNQDDRRDAVSYTEEELQVLLKLLHSRFTKLIPPAIRPKHWGTTLPLIAPAVAMYNKNLTKGQAPLQLSMEFARHIYDEDLNNGTSLDINIYCADKANEIQPGTVNTLILQYGGLFEDTGRSPKDALEEIKASEARIKLAKFPYKMGAMFHTANCEEASVTQYLAEIMEKLVIVQFDMWPDQEHYNLGMEKALLEFYAEFERCITNVRKVNPKIQIGFRTRWADSSPQGIQNITALVHFWREVAIWAEKRNTTIVFHEAFDQPSKRLYYGSTNGWWRLDPSRFYDSVYNYAFQEKASLVIPVQFRASQGEIKEAGSGTTWIIVGVVLVAVIFVIVAVGVAYVYKLKLSHVEQVLLTKMELEQFFHGRSGSFVGEPEYGIDTMEGMAYNVDYEVEKDDFKIDMYTKLGSGQFGLILKAVLNDVEVAVKTVNPKCPSLTTLKGFLSEIKVLTFLGKHEHVVSLLGACTSELGEGKVYLFLELCTKGSLEKRLRRYADILKDTGDGPTYDNVRYSKDPSMLTYDNLMKAEVSTAELVRWSFEIADGMEFLASKQVVHADLATRNILLTENLTCKISDFGLSRRLYDYTNYVKKQQEPLPWRWMAPDALRRLEFNEKTDVWAFGVTLWEIFSLGDVPYPGYTWNMDFLKSLEDGLRLGEPKHKCPGVYAVMLRCWEGDPASRPAFNELRAIFHVQVDAHQHQSTSGDIGVDLSDTEVTYTNVVITNSYSNNV